MTTAQFCYKRNDPLFLVHEDKAALTSTSERPLLQTVLSGFLT